MTDLEIHFHAYMGSDHAQHIQSELGKGTVEHAYLEGVRDALQLLAEGEARHGRLYALREIGRAWIELAEQFGTIKR